MLENEFLGHIHSSFQEKRVCGKRMRDPWAQPTPEKALPSPTQRRPLYPCRVQNGYSQKGFRSP